MALLGLIKADPTPHCCDTCPEGTILTYSIVSFPGKACGRGCVKSSDFWKYKIFEPHLERAKDNNAHPCKDNGYATYWETETHGVPGLLSISVDLYHPTQEEPVEKQELLGEDEGVTNPYADDFEKYGLYGPEDDQLDYTTLGKDEDTQAMLGEDEGDMNPFADDFEQHGLYGNETHPVVESGLLGEDEGVTNPFADDFEKYGLYGPEDDQLDYTTLILGKDEDGESTHAMLGEDEGDMNPFADDFEKHGLYGNETHPVVEAGLLGEDQGSLNPFADDFEENGLYGKEVDPEEDELFGGEGHDEMNPFADDFDRYGIYGPDNVQCPPGKDTCNFAPGKSECCKTGEFCIPNVGCRCEEPPKDLKDDSHSDPVDISEMYIV